MKIFILILFVIISSSAKCQMNRLFYGNDWSDLPALADSIKVALPGYALDSMASSKNGKTETMFFKDASGQLLEVNIVKAHQITDKIFTIQMVGSKDAVLALYRHYLDDKDQQGASYPVLIRQLPGGQNLPIACFQDQAKPGRWILASRNSY